MAVIDLFIRELKREKERYSEICILFDARDGKRKIEARRRYFRQAGKRMGVRIYTAKIYNKIVVDDRKPKKPKKDDTVAWVFDPVAASQGKKVASYMEYGDGTKKVIVEPENRDVRH